MNFEIPSVNYHFTWRYLLMNHISTLRHLKLLTGSAVLFAGLVLSTSSHAARIYYSISEDVWMKDNLVCIDCTEENGFLQPVVRNGYYYDSQLRVWMNKYGICQTCNEANGFENPPKERAKNAPEEGAETVDANTVTRVTASGTSSTLTEVQASSTTLETSSPVFRECEDALSHVVAEVVKDSGRVILEDALSSAPAESRKIQNFTVTTDVTGTGQFQIPNGWMKFSYTCSYAEKKLIAVEWLRQQVFSMK